MGEVKLDGAYDWLVGWWLWLGYRRGYKERLPGFWLGNQSPETMIVTLLTRDLGGGGEQV